jgi:hypothetical protein
VAVDPTGKFVYVTNPDYTTSGGDNVSAYTINAASGALTPVKGSPFSAGGDPFGVTVDPKAKFAYVTNFGSLNVSAYTIKARSGTLAEVKGSPFGASGYPNAIATCRVKAGKCIPPPLYQSSWLVPFVLRVPLVAPCPSARQATAPCLLCGLCCTVDAT